MRNPWLLLLVGLILAPFAQAEEKPGSLYLAYIREVYNELYLNDFQLGSEETIKDTDGHGGTLGLLLGNDLVSFFTLEAGVSHTRYYGVVEDGVNVDFKPQSGSGFEALSSSKNIFYDVDLEFTNPYVAIAYTNWNIPRGSWEVSHQFVLPPTYEFGLIRQSTSGRVIIRGLDGSQIAKATYDSGIRRYFAFGGVLNYEFVLLGFKIRWVEPPTLTVTECNDAAVGATACERIKAATGNRNNSSQSFLSGVLTTGIIF